MLLVLADGCDGTGVTFRGQAYLAEVTGFTARTVSAHMAVLERAGLIGRVQRFRKNGSRTSDYTVLAVTEGRGQMSLPTLGEVPDSVRDLADHRKNLPVEKNSIDHRKKRGGPDPSEEPSVMRGARAGARLTISGKPVLRDAWVLTGDILKEFNAQTGREMRLLTSGGEASEAGKRIYLRVVAYPDLTLDDHRRIIENTLASHWWGDERESIGVVYGPKVFEDNISRKATRRVTKLTLMEDARRRAQEAAARIKRQKGDER